MIIILVLIINAVIGAQVIGIVQMTIRPNQADWVVTLLDRIGCWQFWASLIITMMITVLMIR